MAAAAATAAAGSLRPFAGCRPAGARAGGGGGGESGREGPMLACTASGGAPTGGAPPASDALAYVPPPQTPFRAGGRSRTARALGRRRSAR